MGKRLKDTDFRWADAEQASSRLRGTYVMYDDDVFYINRVHAPSTGLAAEGQHIRTGKGASYPLDDPNFHGFRKLPPLGWVNLCGVDRPTAMYLRRLPARSNPHGLKNGRISCHELVKGSWNPSRSHDFSGIVKDRGYRMGLDGDYPTPAEIMEKLRVPTTVAFSRLFAISRNLEGEFSLYRRADRVGSLREGEIVVGKGTEWCKEELESTLPEGLTITVKR